MVRQLAATLPLLFYHPKLQQPTLFQLVSTHFSDVDYLDHRFFVHHGVDDLPHGLYLRHSWHGDGHYFPGRGDLCARHNRLGARRAQLLRGHGRLQLHRLQRFRHFPRTRAPLAPQDHHPANGGRANSKFINSRLSGWLRFPKSSVILCGTFISDINKRLFATKGR